MIINCGSKLRHFLDILKTISIKIAKEYDFKYNKCCLCPKKQTTSIVLRWVLFIHLHCKYPVHLSTVRSNGLT